MAKTSEQPKANILQPRPPVVVVLGHVDHGKSSLLEAIREDFKITAKESGGITQHVGAYEVEHPSAGSGQVRKITFLDTPGHEAFSAIRSRGAKVADIAVLVVAAEEGVKPQTKEAILHAKSAGIPIIVALNKIDNPAANPQKVKMELAKAEVVVESMGGQVPAAEVSAKTGKGIKELLELILLVAEMEELRANFSGPAKGVVIEAYLDSRRGPTATLLVRNGTLRGENIVGTSSAVGKVKILENFQNQAIAEAAPSTPAIVVGFEEVPQVGEEFKVFEDAPTAIKYLKKKESKTKIEVGAVVEPGKKIFNIILKADVQGSLEAIGEVLRGLPQENIYLRIIDGGIGDIGEGDVKLARSAKASITGFRVKLAPQVAKLAENYDVPIRTFDIIYELVQGIRQLMEKSLELEIVRKDLGRMKVLVVFLTEKNRQIIGGRIIEGDIRKSLALEILRDQTLVGKGKILNLQENKKDIEKAQKGQEVGILYEGTAAIQVGDTLIFYIEERKKPTL